MNNPIQVRDGVVSYTRDVSGGRSTITLEADGIRQGPTGTHARLAIKLDGAIKAYSLFNTDRHEERIKLSRVAYEKFTSDVVNTYSLSTLQQEIDVFCYDLWQRFVESQEPGYLSGDPNLPQSFTLRPLILRGGGSILFGVQGKGKSYTALIMSVCIDAGIDTLWQVTQCRAMYVNLERGEASIQRRLGLVNQALGLDPTRELLVLNARGRSLVDMKDVIQRVVERERVGFLVLDSISRAGSDLIDNYRVNVIADTLNSLAPTWLGLGHSPRHNEEHLYGSIFFDAAADIMVRLTSEDNGTESGIKLEVRKANDIRVPRPIYLAYKFTDDVGLTSIRTASASDFPTLASQTQMSLRDEIKEYLLSEAGEDHATHIAEQLGRTRSHIAKLLSNDKTFVKTKKLGTSQLYGVAKVGGNSNV